MIMSDEQYAVVAAKDAEIASLRRTVGMGETAIRNLTAEVERLRAALRQYGGHRGCHGWLTGRECKCGWLGVEAALAQPAATGEGT